jgi:hypothetical protein
MNLLGSHKLAGEVARRAISHLVVPTQVGTHGTTDRAAFVGRWAPAGACAWAGRRPDPSAGVTKGGNAPRAADASGCRVRPDFLPAPSRRHPGLEPGSGNISRPCVARRAVSHLVVPTQVGTHGATDRAAFVGRWAPAFAGVTKGGNAPRASDASGCRVPPAPPCRHPGLEPIGAKLMDLFYRHPGGGRDPGHLAQPSLAVLGSGFRRNDVIILAPMGIEPGFGSISKPCVEPGPGTGAGTTVRRLSLRSAVRRVGHRGRPGDDDGGSGRRLPMPPSRGHGPAEP